MPVATAWGQVMTQLTSNSGGAIQSIPGTNLYGPPFVETLTLAAQASGTVIGVARLPLYATFLGIVLVSSVTLGTATIAFGDSNTAARFAAAATFTTPNVPTQIGLEAAFIPI